MTTLMQMLYDYTFRHLMLGLLTTDEYQGEQVLLDRRERAVLDALPESAQARFREFQDSRATCTDIELEAMFQAALTLARDLP